MFIGHHISTDYHEVLLSDSISFVLDKMTELHCKQMAVVEEGVFYGLIEENQLLDESNTALTMESLKNTLRPIYLFDYQHIYDALQMIAHNDFCFIPILDKNHHYLGSLTKQSILIALNTILGNEESAIIVLELGPRDNALSHIAHIIEAENTNIYSTAIHQIPDSSDLALTIKVNRTNLSAVVAALNRNNYPVKATFRDSADQTDIQNRYDLLMNYLDL